MIFQSRQPQSPEWDGLRFCDFLFSLLPRILFSSFDFLGLGPLTGDLCGFSGSLVGHFSQRADLEEVFLPGLQLLDLDLLVLPGFDLEVVELGLASLCRRFFVVQIDLLRKHLDQGSHLVSRFLVSGRLRFADILIFAGRPKR